MGVFANIMAKIFHHPSANAAAAPASTPATQQPQPDRIAPAPGTPTIEAAGGGETTPVDVAAVLEAMASLKENRGGNYKSSIVDLLKLLDLNPSLSARKELAEELDVHAEEDGSAEQNIALHRAVMAKLAENGGVVPDSMRH
ncbi:DUF3597 domain-containing protein (plasmid) [Novosphingobium sp. BL-8A]|uniref:DUF3597 domain-containing protein n=1 Tax=Novosphingobium sp. BL-8A TaxID=3127639 RepID=UPI003756A103